MDTLYELTEAECEAVAGGAGGQIVAEFNHFRDHGPGFFVHIPGSETGTGAHTGKVVSSEVHLVQTFGPNVTEPFWKMGMGLPP